MLSQLVLPSTFFLNLLLMVGLFFFVRASTKDRTERKDWLADKPGDEVLSQVESFLTGRSYRITEVKPEEAKVVFEGLVRPSLGLAILLVSMVALGLMALSIVLSMTLPGIGPKFILLVLISPLAGFFYWRGAERIETVVVQVAEVASSDQSLDIHTKLRISAHRDELLALQSAIPYQVV